jgi:hypothetical protein
MTAPVKQVSNKKKSKKMNLQMFSDNLMSLTSLEVSEHSLKDLNSLEYGEKSLRMSLTKKKSDDRH